MRSSRAEVSVVRKRLKISAMIFPRFFFLNGGLSSSLLIASLISPPSGKKYLAGTPSVKLALFGSCKYGRPSGMMSLKRILPTVVSKTLCFCSSVHGLLRLSVAIPTREWR